MTSSQRHTKRRHSHDASYTASTTHSACPSTGHPWQSQTRRRRAPAKWWRHKSQTTASYKVRLDGNTFVSISFNTCVYQKLKHKLSRICSINDVRRCTKLCGSCVSEQRNLSQRLGIVPLRLWSTLQRNSLRDRFVNKARQHIFPNMRNIRVFVCRAKHHSGDTYIIWNKLRNQRSNLPHSDWFEWWVMWRVFVGRKRHLATRTVRIFPPSLS